MLRPVDLYSTFTSLHGITSRKTGVFIDTAVRTSDLSVMSNVLYSFDYFHKYSV
jgi:hypothetical protein